MYVKLTAQPQNLSQALVIAEAHLAAIGLSELSPTKFVREAVIEGNNLVTASIFPLTKLREREVVPGLKLRSGSSTIEVTKVLPSNREVVYKTSRGGIFRIPLEKFVKLALQQGYKKVWNIKNFLITLKALLKPVLDAIPLMWVLKWVLSAIRGRSSHLINTQVPMNTDKIETGTRVENVEQHNKEYKEHHSKRHKS